MHESHFVVNMRTPHNFVACISPTNSRETCKDLLFQICQLQVGMCLAPLMHKRLNLYERAEVALCGFISMDLFKLVSIDLQRHMQVPTGSTFLAPQTSTNLQACALAGLSICLGKDEKWNPWQYGEGRLTEAGIEQYFGHLRGTSQNSQLSCRMYYVAAAKHALRSSKGLNKDKPPHDFNERPLTQEEPLIRYRDL